jgi:hypothetical protein
MLHRETCHICWFAKMNSHVIVPNFSMETQSTNSSILVWGTV